MGWIVKAAAGMAALLLSAGAAWAQAPAAPVLRISTENTADHVQTRSVQAFAALVNQRAGGRLTASVHHSAELYRDRDVIKALGLGRVEMAVPGTWQLDRFVPDVGLFLLPGFYGREPGALNRLRDGELGRRVSGEIEDSLNVVVPGRWIDLGHANLFTVDRPIRDHKDLAGRRIRIAGGESNAWRLRQLGAEPQLIPWPDFPNALRLGLVDGVLTTFETVASARLWEHGIRHCFRDRQYFAQYVPMVSRSFWVQLPPDLQALVRQAWEESVEPARQAAALAQQQARAELEAHGVQCVQPAPEALARERARMQAKKADLLLALGLDPMLVETVEAALGDAP